MLCCQRVRPDLITIIVEAAEADGASRSLLRAGSDNAMTSQATNAMTGSCDARGVAEEAGVLDEDAAIHDDGDAVVLCLDGGGLVDDAELHP